MKRDERTVIIAVMVRVREFTDLQPVSLDSISGVLVNQVVQRTWQKENDSRTITMMTMMMMQVR